MLLCWILNCCVNLTRTLVAQTKTTESHWRVREVTRWSCWLFRWGTSLHTGLSHSKSGWLSAEGQEHRLLPAESEWPKLHRSPGPGDSHGGVQFQQHQQLWVRGHGGFSPYTFLAVNRRSQWCQWVNLLLWCLVDQLQPSHLQEHHLREERLN